MPPATATTHQREPRHVRVARRNRIKRAILADLPVPRRLAALSTNAEALARTLSENGHGSQEDEDDTSKKKTPGRRWTPDQRSSLADKMATYQTDAFDVDRQIADNPNETAIDPYDPNGPTALPEWRCRPRAREAGNWKVLSGPNLRRVKPPKARQRVWRKAVNRSSLHSTAKVVLAAAAEEFADADGQSMFPSRAEIADVCGPNVSVRTVCRYIEQAEADGWLKRLPRIRRNGSRSTDWYVLEIPDEWFEEGA